MFCPQCSNEILSERMRFCTRCSFPLGTVKELVAAEAAKTSQMKERRIILCPSGTSRSAPC
jgi:hypothetical protein